MSPPDAGQPAGDGSLVGNVADLARRAQQEYAAWGNRAEVLGDRLLASPSWNMLLDLVISTARNQQVSVSALCIGSRASAATALRYLGLLEEAGLVERTADMADGRRHYVRLTDLGWRRMSSLLG